MHLNNEMNEYRLIALWLRVQNKIQESKGVMIVINLRVHA